MSRLWDDCVLQEKYIDSDKIYYDYGTAAVHGNDVVDTTKTGMSFYDEFLNSASSKYLQQEKNLVGNITMMSPEEYYSQCSQYGFIDGEHSVESLKRGRRADTKILSHLRNVLTVIKRKFPMPILNKAERSQEGLHRMMVIGDMFGWDHKVPVLVVDWADKQKAYETAKRKRIERIEYNIKKAVMNALLYKFNNIDELREQIQWELNKQFEYSSDIDTPVQFELTSDDSFKFFTVSIGAASYEFDYDDVKFVDAADDLDVDDIEVDDIEDFLVRYFGDDWRETNPHLKDTFDIKESITSTQFDIVKKCAKEARQYIVSKYGTGTDLCGKCIEASDYLVDLLNTNNIKAKAVEGYIVYDDDSCCSDRAWDEHTWVELEDGTIVDVTVEQFNYMMYEEYPPILIEKNPHGYVYEKPNFLWLDELTERYIFDDLKDTFNIKESYQDNIPPKLYHATYKQFLKSIKNRGLGNTRRKMWGDSVNGIVYLADDPEVAISYAETSEWVEEQDDYEKYVENIVVLEIDSNKLDKSRLKVDSNVLLDNGEKNSTWEYHGVIPWKDIHVLVNNDDNYLGEDLTTKTVRRDNPNDFSPFGYKVDFYDGDNHIGEGSVCGIKDDNAFLYDFEVYPEFRGKGYSKEMLQYLIDQYDLKQLFVKPDNNVAINLYKKYGFDFDDDYFGDSDSGNMRLMIRESIQSLNSIVNNIYKEYQKYDKDEGLNQNCMLCAWAVELQLRGYDFLPRPVYSPNDVIFTSLNGYDIVKNPKKIFFDDYDDLINKLNVVSSGRFYCHVNWAGCTGGHEFLLIKENDVIKIVDAQDNKIETLTPHSAYFNDINYSNSFIVRVDDKPINKEMLKYNDIKYAIPYEYNGGLNESVNQQLYFISTEDLDGKTLQPRVPDNYFTKRGYEDGETPRVCFAPSIDQCLMAISQKCDGIEFYVYSPVAIDKNCLYKPSTKEVPDSTITGEIWITCPVKIKKIGKIKVLGDSGLDGHPFNYGDKTAELYDWDWEWVSSDLKEDLHSFSDVSSIKEMDKIIQQHWAFETPGEGCIFISPNGNFINIYPQLDDHEDLCYWLEENGFEDTPGDAEWFVSEFDYVRCRNSPHLCFVEVPQKMTSAQYSSLEEWLEEKVSSDTIDIEAWSGEWKTYNLDDYFSEDIIKIIKRSYASGKLYEKLR